MTAILLGMLWFPLQGTAEKLTMSVAAQPAPVPLARVVAVVEPGATQAFQARPEKIPSMIERGLLRLTGQTNIVQAWRSLATTNETLGVKIHSAPGAQSGTRPAVTVAVVQSLLSAGFSPDKIILWDRKLTDLRLAGFFAMAEQYGIRVSAADQEGYDDKVFYENPILGKLVWGDLEFQPGKKDNVGRKSHLSKLLTRRMDKIIVITPLLNHNEAGVTGCLYTLALGGADNVLRFENDRERLATAVPELYALPELADRVVLNIVDALICQYEGGERSLVHYSSALDQLWFGKDPVALDTLSLHEMERQRQAAKQTAGEAPLELVRNAALLELGICDTNRISVDCVP